MYKKIFTAICLTTCLYFVSDISVSEEHTPSDYASRILAETENSARWKFMGKTKSGYFGFLDVERFFIEGSERNAWTKVIYSEDGLEKEIDGKNRRIVYSITNRIYDCAGKRLSDLTLVDYDSEGNSYSTDFKKLYRAYPEKKWIDIAPESLGDYLLEFICKYGK